MAICKICHKRLTETLSVKLGIGPVCRMNRKMQQSGDDLFNRDERACYDYNIVDNARGRTVTNDAARVIADLIADGLDLTTHPVIYRDTGGVWDRLLVEKGLFTGFAPLTAAVHGEAIEKLRSAKIRVSAAERAWQADRAGAGDFTHIDYQTGKAGRSDSADGMVESFLGSFR
jgi:hypothetical protein